MIEGGPNLDSTPAPQGLAGLREKARTGSVSIPDRQRNLPVCQRISGAKQLLAYQPTALLCFNDEMAFGARTAIAEAGLKVPDDVSLIGFDNWDMSGYNSMKLTTVERNMGEIAKEGTRVLLRRLEDGIVDNSRTVLENSPDCP